MTKNLNAQSVTNCYFLVFARDGRHVIEKIEELSKLKVPFLIICGERLNHPNVIYRSARGKYEAINFAEKLIPKGLEIIALNDVDTKICGFCNAFQDFMQKKAALLCARVAVREGVQNQFLLIENLIRKLIPVVADGDLMIIKRKMLGTILPLEPCKAEDTYILFKTLEHKGKVVFCDKCYVETSKTKSLEEEKYYKRRTVCGIYQALSYANPSILVKLFYDFLPFLSPLLLVFGKKGYCWTKGILLGFTDYLLGDYSGFW